MPPRRLHHSAPLSTALTKRGVAHLRDPVVLLLKVGVYRPALSWWGTGKLLALVARAQQTLAAILQRLPAMGDCERLSSNAVAFRFFGGLSAAFCPRNVWHGSHIPETDAHFSLPIEI